jgi:Domain of unknown function (DUF932)
VRKPCGLSGQNYEVIRRPIHVDGKEVVDPLRVATALADADTGAVLGIVGDHAVRKIIQNKSLYDVLEPVVAEGEAVYETGGVLKGGAVVWALAQLEKHRFCIGKEDLVRMYTLTALASRWLAPIYRLSYGDPRGVLEHAVAGTVHRPRTDKRTVTSIVFSNNDAYEFSPSSFSTLAKGTPGELSSSGRAARSVRRSRASSNAS